MKDYLFRGKLSELDPDVYEVTELEAERQYRKLILIPSESQSPMAVRQAMASAFQNIYAEGYPRDETRWVSEQEEITRLRGPAGALPPLFRPSLLQGGGVRRYHRELARRRCAELFATGEVLRR